MVRTNKGFTLVELMVVIVIIGILAALAIPKFTEASNKAKVSEIPTVVGSWDHGVLARIAEAGGCPLSADEIVFEQPESKWFVYDDSYTGAITGPVSMLASVKENMTIGALTNATTNTAATGANSSIDQNGAVTHTVGAFGIKYLGNFAVTPGAGSGS